MKDVWKSKHQSNVANISSFVLQQLKFLLLCCSVGGGTLDFFDLSPRTELHISFLGLLLWNRTMESAPVFFAVWGKIRQYNQIQLNIERPNLCPRLFGNIEHRAILKSHTDLFLHQVRKRKKTYYSIISKFKSNCFANYLHAYLVW